MNTPLSRRTAPQAAGATAFAAGLSGGLTATAAHADDDTNRTCTGTHANPSLFLHVTNPTLITTAEAEAVAQ